MQNSQRLMLSTPRRASFRAHARPALALLVMMLSSGCGLLSIPKSSAPAVVVCSVEHMRKCDLSSPEIPAEISADLGVDLAAYYVRQRNECSELNDAKAACISTEKKGKK